MLIKIDFIRSQPIPFLAAWVGPALAFLMIFQSKKKKGFHICMGSKSNFRRPSKHIHIQS
jgi:hypothetical protein